MLTPQAGRGNDRARRIQRSDWSWLAAWAQDPVVDLRLGPVDLEWLEHVLGDDQGVEVVVEDSRGDPIGLVGCVWDPTGVAHVISDIAVDPERRRAGLGRRALFAALSWSGHPSAQMWLAFVDEENDPAREFFRGMGWVDEGMDEGMVRMSSPPVGAPASGIAER